MLRGYLFCVHIPIILLCYNKIMATVYLIHFDAPLKHARHYIGYTALESLDMRINRHKSGNGARILAACNQQGITWKVAKTWEFENAMTARNFEQKLKRQKHAPRLCPICNKF